jgi:ABC-2 type transport system ATP-binding protein
MADRVGVINKGELILVEEKASLMKKLGKKELTVHLQEPMTSIPAALSDWPLTLKASGADLDYLFDVNDEHQGIPALLRKLSELGIAYKDLNTKQSSLEDIFVGLVSDRHGDAHGATVGAASAASAGNARPGALGAAK